MSDNPRYEIYLIMAQRAIRILFLVSPNLKRLASFFQVSFRFHPLHPWMQTTKNSFSELQWSLATKLQHYFSVFIDARTYFSVLKFD